MVAKNEQGDWVLVPEGFQPGKVAGALFDLKITADPQYF